MADEKKKKKQLLACDLFHTLGKYYAINHIYVDRKCTLVKRHW